MWVHCQTIGKRRDDPSTCPLGSADPAQVDAELQLDGIGGSAGRIKRGRDPLHLARDLIRTEIRHRIGSQGAAGQGGMNGDDVGRAGRELQHPPAAATHQERGPRLLDGSWQTTKLADLVMLPVEGDLFAAEQSINDLEQFRQPLDSHGCRIECQTQGLIIRGLPACADPGLQPTFADPVDGCPGPDRRGWRRSFISTSDRRRSRSLAAAAAAMTASGSIAHPCATCSETATVLKPRSSMRRISSRQRAFGRSSDGMGAMNRNGRATVTRCAPACGIATMKLAPRARAPASCCRISGASGQGRIRMSSGRSRSISSGAWMGIRQRGRSRPCLSGDRSTTNRNCSGVMPATLSSTVPRAAAPYPATILPPLRAPSRKPWRSAVARAIWAGTLA